jgi:O-antigen/teichoic acid export membrane protein
VNLTDLRGRSFAARYLTLFGGEVFSKLCVMAAFAYLARVLSPGDYGTVEWALSLTVFFVLGVESGMGLYGARVVAASPDRIPQLVPQVMVLRAVLGLPAFALILAASVRYQVAGLGLLAINGIAVLLTPFLTQWVFQGLRQMQWVAAGTALRNFAFVGLIVAMVRPGSDIRLVAIAEVSGIALLALFNAVILFRRLRVQLDWRDLMAGTRRLFRDVWFMGFGDFTWACLWYSPALIVERLGLGMEQVAWVAASVRVVLALHTFVWLYFFNLLPNLARELAGNLDDWRGLMQRSMATSMWPACLVALGGTLIAPLLLPMVFGDAYRAAVLPFQIVIWMIPVAWFSGHFRFSLIAAGLQRREFVVSAASAAVTVSASVLLGYSYGSVGAAGALLTGGIVNLILAIAASHRYIGVVPIAPSVGPALVATVVCLAAGLAVAASAGALAGAVVGCGIYVALAARQDNELVRMVRRRITARR